MPEDHDHPQRAGAGANADADRTTDRMRVNSNPESAAHESVANSSTRTQTGPHNNSDHSNTSASGNTTRISYGQIPDASELPDLGVPQQHGSVPRQPNPAAQAQSSGDGGDRTHPEMRSAESPTERVRKDSIEADAERTQTISAVPPGVVPESAAEKTQSITPVPAEPTARWVPAAPPGPPIPPPPPPPLAVQEPGGRKNPQNRRGLVRAGVTAGIAAGVLLLLYIGDLVFTSGQVPRGTVVADVEIGGMDKASAERELRDQLSPRLREPITIKAGDTQASISPDQAGLKMDWSATVEQAGSQSWNPITRVTSLFSTQEVAPVSRGDRTMLRQALEQVKPELDRAPAEGTIKFEDAKPVAVDPVSGRTVDVAGATNAVLADWAGNGPVEVPFTEQPVSTTREGVQKALREVAQPAVSAPVTVRGEGKDATLTPETIASVLRFEPDGQGGLRSRVDIPAAGARAEPQLAGTIQPGKDAQIVLQNGAPVVHPSTDGRGVDWNRSFERLTDVLKQKRDRSVQAIYMHQPAKFTTDQANQLGIREVVSEFQTGGFEPASGVNIRRVAEQVNGAIVKPGDTFSLNGHTGPRGIAQGYIESGIIEDGRPQKAVGGGISQFATTIFNASYFAGMKDVEHKEHSYYISRYPAGREATVFQTPEGKSIIDVKFKNTAKSGIMITTEWTPSSIKIKFWGTKQFEVTSQTGPKSPPIPPQEKVVPPGQPCSPSKGTPGFSVTDTRTIKHLDTGQVVTEPASHTKYEPQPIIHCPPPPPPPR